MNDIKFFDNNQLRRKSHSSLSLVTPHSSLLTPHSSLLTIPRHSSLILFLLFVILSCSPSEETQVSAPALINWSGAYPMAVLKTGSNPLWFQLTEDGPVHIETIEDAAFTAPLTPWPYALHINFMEETSDGIVMTVNRDGFLKLAANSQVTAGLGLYRFPGGDFWKQYTVGGFVFYQGFYTAVLYLDNRFLQTNEKTPKPRAWAFNMNSNEIFSLEIPALQVFPEDEMWDIDTLRTGSDKMIYFRAAKRKTANPEIKTLRTNNLSSKEAEEITTEVFFNSAPRKASISHPSLPVLPEGFVYTSLGYTGGSLFASWEEQEDFSIGAAGFVVMKY